MFGKRLGSLPVAPAGTASYGRLHQRMGREWEKRGSRLVGYVAVVVVAACVLAMPVPAGAAVTCSYDQATDTMAVDSSAGAGSTEVAIVSAEAVGGEIAVSDVNSQIACSGAGGPPSGSNTELVNLTGGGGDTVYFVGDPQFFAPGPAGDLDFIAALGSGNDGVGVGSGDGDDFWVLGAGGMNWNGDMDVDLNLLSVEEIGMFAGNGADALTARGQDGTGAPYAGRLSADGNDGNDVIEGGDGADFLLGGENDDTLRGFGGGDDLTGDSGTNQLVGGPGDDLADYLGAPLGVNVDLSVTGPQSTGLGTDTLSEIEGLSGSNGTDTLSGNDSANRLLGQDADDVLDGRGGPDELIGGNGVNTATYATAPAAVSASLDTGTASGGAGNDTIQSVANLIGSPFADTLTGDSNDNSIIALAGPDTVAAEAGTDVVNVRDGGPDTASCGDGIDSATADQASVDSVNADCENTDFIPEPNGGGGGNGPPTGPGDTEVSFDLSGKARQRVVEQKGVIVKASCPAEDCTATASGTARVPKPKGGRRPRAKFNLRPVTEQVSAGVTEKVELPIAKRRLRAMKAALRAGKKPKVTVTANVTDAFGNAATDRLTVRARR